MTVIIIIALACAGILIVEAVVFAPDKIPFMRKKVKK